MEKPILFSGLMVRAILEGRKTQTRRVVKPQPERRNVTDVGAMLGFKRKDADGFWLWPNAREQIIAQCPYGQPGDLLWVRETTIKVEDHGFLGPVYLASDEGRAIWDYGLGSNADDIEISPDELRLRPAIHMPRSVSRLTLRITDVRVQRLQEISEEDAMAEGAIWQDGNDTGHSGWRHDPLDGFIFDSVAISFNRLWDRTYGIGAGRLNPWVWAITFEVIEANIASVLAQQAAA